MADVNAQGGLYDNALQAASFGGYEGVVQLQLKHDATIDLTDMQGKYPFHLAFAIGEMKTVKLVSVQWLTRKKATVSIMQNQEALLKWSSGFYKKVSVLMRPIEMTGPLCIGLPKTGASCTTESIEGWTPDVIAIFHRNQFSSTLHNDADYERTTSELAPQESINHSAATMRLRSKGQKFGRAILVSFVFDFSDTSSAYMLHNVNVRTVQILVLVSNAKVLPTKPTWVTVFKYLNQHSILLGSINSTMDADPELKDSGRG